MISRRDRGWVNVEMRDRGLQTSNSGKDSGLALHQGFGSRWIIAVLAFSLGLISARAMAERQNAQQIGGIGGKVTALALQDDLVFMSEGPYLLIVDVSDLTTPSLISRLEFPDLITAVDVSGSIAAVAGEFEADLHIVDIADPLQPSIVAHVELPGYGRDVSIVGSTVLYTSSISTFFYDISDPSSPFQLSVLPRSIGSRPGHATLVDGDIAYVGGDANEVGGFDIFDISNPRAPLLLNTVSGPVTPSGRVGPNALAVENSFLYMITSELLQIYDRSDPNDVILLSELEKPIPGGLLYDVEVRDSIAYVTDAINGFFVVDVTSPENPVHRSTFSPGGGAQVIATAGDLLYFADRFEGLKIVDVSDPSRPTQLSGFESGGEPYSATVDFPLVYTGNGPGGLKVIDISDPENPSLVSTFNQSLNVFDVERKDSYLYVADFDTGLQIVDVSNPLEMELATLFELSSMPLEVELFNDRAYVTEYNGIFSIIDISTPTSPTLIGSLFAGTTATEMSLYLDTETGPPTPRYAYLSSREGNLRIIDLADERAPQPAGTVAFDGNINGVDVDQSTPGEAYLYLGVSVNQTQFRGLLIYDLTEPDFPELIAEHQTRGNPAEVEVSNQFAYVADGSRGVTIVDVADPFNPTAGGFHTTRGETVNLDVHGSMAYVADSIGGLKLIRLSGARIVDAEILRHTIPEEIPAGETIIAEVTVRNYGQLTWNQTVDVALSVGEDSCAIFELIVPGGMIPQGDTVLSEGDHTFEISITAPAEEGDCMFSLTMFTSPELQGGPAGLGALGISPSPTGFFGQPLDVFVRIGPSLAPPNSARHWSLYD